MAPTLKTAEDWFQEGLRHLDLSRGADTTREYEGDLTDAVDAFERVISLDRAHAAAHRQRALTLLQLDRYDEALDAFAAALHYLPGDVDLLSGLAKAHAAKGSHEAALLAFEGVLQADAGNEEALVGRASALTGLGQLMLALPAWNAAVVATKGFLNERAELARATCLARLGRPEAVTAFREVFSSRALNRQGYAEPLRTLEVARVAYRVVVQARAKHADAWQIAGSVWASAGRHSEALEAYEAAVALAPDSAQAWFGKAEAHAQAGHDDDALAAYRKALELWPEFLAASARIKVLEAKRKTGPWRVMGRDTFAREDYVVGQYATREEAEAAVRAREASVAPTQDVSVRDDFWIVPPQ